MNIGYLGILETHLIRFTSGIGVMCNGDRDVRYQCLGMYMEHGSYQSIQYISFAKG